MKSEERHELQKNDLQTWIFHAVDFLQRSWLQICLVVMLILAFYVGYNMWRAKQEGKIADAWMEYEGAKGFDLYESVVKKYPDTPVVPFAKLRMADQKYSEAQVQLMGQRDNARPALEKAESLYKELANDNSAPEFIRIQAAFGMASALESLGSVDEAEKQLTAISEKYAKSDKYKLFAKQAEERAKQLATPEAKVFYQKYTNFKPSTPSLDLPAKGDLSPLDRKSLAPLDNKATDSKPSDAKATDDKSKKDDKKAETTKPIIPGNIDSGKDSKPAEKVIPPPPAKMTEKPKG